MSGKSQKILKNTFNKFSTTRRSKTIQKPITFVFIK